MMMMGVGTRRGLGLGDWNRDYAGRAGLFSLEELLLLLQSSLILWSLMLQSLGKRITSNGVLFLEWYIYVSSSSSCSSSLIFSNFFLPVSDVHLSLEEIEG